MIEKDLVPKGAHAKNTGAYYTDQKVAQFLVRWGIRTPEDRVLDPSAGGGVFVEAALQRLAIMKSGRSPHGTRGTADKDEQERQVFGIELDPTIHQAAKDALEQHGWGTRARLIHADFFDVTESLAVDCVVGNPPFIRYQRFNGDSRKKALTRARALGVTLSELSSSWAPFIVASTAHLRPGGRLAMVAPMELGHAAYARPVLEYLHRSFGEVIFLTFESRLFPDISEDTLLVLGDDFCGVGDCGRANSLGASSHPFTWADLAGPASLEAIAGPKSLKEKLEPLETEAMLHGKRRLLHHVLDGETRALYDRLVKDQRIRRLGELANVGIGYVTGVNDFFHLRPEEARDMRIDPSFLRRAVRRGRSLKGIVYRAEDWNNGLETGASGELLLVPPETDLEAAGNEGLKKYLKSGKKSGYHTRFKCQVRTPWYSVPHVYEPAAFLTYMSGTLPSLVANQALAVAPNSLHVVRKLPNVSLNPEELALCWHTSLTWLSAELEGHGMGGGMLKLEPGEASQVVLAIPHLPPHRVLALTKLADDLMRHGDYMGTLAHVDLEVLEGGLELSREDCLRLRDGAMKLSRRRRMMGGTDSKGPKD